MKKIDPVKNEAVDFHAECMKIAKRLIPRHVEMEGQIKCFNRHTFLECLESELITTFCGKKSLNGKFELDPSAVASYLWCCLALEEGSKPGGFRFGNMPILD